MTADEAFDPMCQQAAEAIQQFIDMGPGAPERDSLLLRMRALGMRPEHIARLLQVIGEIEARIENDGPFVLH